MIIRVANLMDNDQLVKLADLTPMQGNISICIQRKPDFFSVLNTKGKPHVIVAENEGTIVGCVSIVEEQMVLLNEHVRFHYLCDLKVRPDFRNKKVATNLSNELLQYLRKVESDFLFCTVAEGNSKVLPLLNGKAGIYDVSTTGKFCILQLVPQKTFEQNPTYQLVPFTDTEKVVKMHNSFYTRYALHPVIRFEDYESCIHYAALKNNAPVAIVSVFDASHLKQNVLFGMPWHVAIALKFLRVLRPVLKTPYLPNKKEAIKILYVKAFSYLPGHEDAFTSVLSFANHVAYTKNYSFLSIAFHETDTLIKRLRKFISFKYKAHGMIYSLKKNNDLINTIKGKKVLEDFSLI